jgi:hypothetical protein
VRILLSLFIALLPVCRLQGKEPVQKEKRSVFSLNIGYLYIDGRSDEGSLAIGVETFFEKSIFSLGSDISLWALAHPVCSFTINAHPLGSKGFDPYLGTGLSISHAAKTVCVDFPLTLGMNLWPDTRSVGLKFQARMFILSGREFLEISGGLNFVL